MKNLFQLLIAIAIVVLPFRTKAEELKKSVLAIERFTYSSSFSEADVEMVRNQIINVIQSTGRVIVADHNSSTDKALASEAARRKQESAMDANEVDDMGTLNANSVLTVHLDQIAVTKEIYEESTGYGDKKVVKGRYPYFRGTITYTVKITDCKNGAVQAQQTFSKSSGSFSTYDHTPTYATEKAAHDGVLNGCAGDDLKIMVMNAFKPEGMILQIDQSDAKKAKTVYVNMGSEDGISKGQTLQVFKEVEIAGEVSRKFIGEIKVEEVMSASRCLAKVSKGGEDILQVLASGGKLPVQARDVKSSFWGGLK